jgi:hypothetical protein
MNTPTDRPGDGLLPGGFTVHLHEATHREVRGPHPERMEPARSAVLILLGGELLDAAMEGHPVLCPAHVRLPEGRVLVVDAALYPRQTNLHRLPDGLPLVAFDVLLADDGPDGRALVLGRRDALLEAGVREVWLVDLRDRSLCVQTARGQRTYRGSQRARSQVVRAAVIEPRRLFEAEDELEAEREGAGPS